MKYTWNLNETRKCFSVLLVKIANYRSTFRTLNEAAFQISICFARNNRNIYQTKLLFTLNLVGKQMNIVHSQFTFLSFFTVNNVNLTLFSFIFTNLSNFLLLIINLTLPVRSSIEMDTEGLVQTFLILSKTRFVICDNAPWYVSNYTTHNYLNIPYSLWSHQTQFQKFHSSLSSIHHPLTHYVHYAGSGPGSFLWVLCEWRNFSIPKSVANEWLLSHAFTWQFV